MNKELIYIGSVNKAFKAKEILKKNNINSTIERGTSLQNKGCGYSILIVEGDKDVAIKILESNKIINES